MSITNSAFLNQVGVITGAASGLGLAMAKKLSAQGMYLALIDLSMDHLKNRTGEFDHPVELIEANITNEFLVKQVIDSVILKWGRIDVLINSAGITGITNVKSHDTSTENIKAVFDVNFMGSYFTSKHVIPHMLNRKYGLVLHIASITGKEGNAGMLAYSASKAAVIGMTKVQGKEYAETGITVNALAPVVIRKALVEKMPDEQVQ